ncbi:MAG: type III pantothenate kinase [Nitrospirae bacterium]|nr:MAG: type III pantothenate kinase [Nitrospirota bacterium]
MLLAIDIGNTNVVFGLFESQTLKGHWRLTTDAFKTADEYGVLFQSLLRAAGIGSDQVTALILSSVVPSLTPTFEHMAETYFHHRMLVVSPSLDTGLRLCYTNPQELGSDRLVNAAAAYARYKTALIIVDLGTATTFQAGLIIGHTGLVDEIVGRMQAELGQTATVIATGGLASLIAPQSRTIQEVRPFLTLEGLELLYRRTRGDD